MFFFLRSWDIIGSYLVIGRIWIIQIQQLERPKSGLRTIWWILSTGIFSKETIESQDNNSAYVPLSTSAMAW